MEFQDNNIDFHISKNTLSKIAAKNAGFEDVFDIVAANFIPKPAPLVYQHFVKKYKIDSEKSVMVEDIVRNLKPAADMGMKTVWVETDRAWAHADAETTKPDFTTNNLAPWLTEVTNF